MFLRKALCKPAVDVTSPCLDHGPVSMCTDHPDTQTRPVSTSRKQGEMCKLGNLRHDMESEVKLTRQESIDKESHNKSGRPMFATFAAMFRPTDYNQPSTIQEDSSTEAAQKSVIPSSQSRPTSNEHQPALFTLASKFWNSASVSNRDLNLMAPVSS